MEPGRVCINWIHVPISRVVVAQVVLLVVYTHLVHLCQVTPVPDVLLYNKLNQLLDRVPHLHRREVLPRHPGTVAESVDGGLTPAASRSGSCSLATLRTVCE